MIFIFDILNRAKLKKKTNVIEILRISLTHKIQFTSHTIIKNMMILYDLTFSQKLIRCSLSHSTLKREEKKNMENS